MYRHEIQFPPKDAALRDDVHDLGALVGEILKEQGGTRLFDLVEGDRVAAIRRREGDPAGDSALRARVLDREPSAAKELVRAFSTWFQVVNLAEQVHRIRRRRQYFLDSAHPQPDGVEDALHSLKAQGLKLEEVLALLAGTRIEPIFTAHPTESPRRTLLRQQQRIARLLVDRLDTGLTPQERRGIWERLRTEITTSWQTEEHQRDRLTVADEREHVLFYLAEILYRIIPAFYDEIESALRDAYGLGDGPVQVPPLVSFGTWVGGDMDGKPDVHAKTIRETLARQQQLILSTYYEECLRLAQKLSQSASRVGISRPLQQRIDEYSALLPGALAITPARHDRMPYRVFLGQVAERLRATYEGRANHYGKALELRRDVELLAMSLEENLGGHAGFFSVRRLLRRIDTFGFHLATLDVRQHASVHHEVLAQGFDDAGWPARRPVDRLERLQDALQHDRGPSGVFDALGRRTLWVFEALAQCRHRYGADAIGDYVVSGVHGADDVLAVLLLARWADTTDRKSGEVPFDVAPLLSSLDSLSHSSDIMRSLLALPVYRRHLEARGNRQSVMVSYSNSNKEGGIAAARWAVHEAYQRLFTAHSGFKINLNFVHGRGGSASRGGRIEALVRSVPAGVVQGPLRFTEEGDVVNQGYGLRPIAMRTLERSFHGLVLRRAQSGEPETSRRLYEQVMRTLAAHSLEKYRRQVYGDPGLYRYFRAATPIDVIERMQIGARPAARDTAETPEGLLAIPWVFAWTQSRCLLPGWFGVGSGLAAAEREHGAALLTRMWEDWPLFTNLIDDTEATLARADLAIAGWYDELVPEGERGYLEPIRTEFELTRAAILKLKNAGELLAGNPTLLRGITLRNPYIDPMHLMQVDLLRRWRAVDREDRALYDALVASIGGITQGLLGTG
ncbi:MAG TPA: phosphoenolpyruvate carboxylase [Steroidobacteraceae bacterium]|nr:phosphoenolpyruvate carboxylase [Steroidobacteraceae bacterium]